MGNREDSIARREQRTENIAYVQRKENREWRLENREQRIKNGQQITENREYGIEGRTRRIEYIDLEWRE